MSVLLDELTAPPLRNVIGTLLSRARRAAVAVSHVRLAAIDLRREETKGLEDMRILLGRLDASELESLRSGGHDRLREHVRTLRDFLGSGRVRIRSAGIAAWSPDFSIYSGIRGSEARVGDGDGSAVRDVCIIGAHYFHQPWIDRGPSFTCLVADACAVNTAARRFDELWNDAHDVLPVVMATIAQVLERNG
jgi:hypothetical protein